MDVNKTYRVVVEETTDFEIGWSDSAIPFMTWVYDQESLDECEEIDGVYYATYKTWVITEPQTRTYCTLTGTQTITIPIGEYGKL